MSAEHPPSDNSDGHDGSTDPKPGNGPDEETYKKHALDGANATLHEELDHIRKKIRGLQEGLREGENPTPEDLMTVQTTLAHSSESIVAALEDLVVGEEPEIVAELRDLALKTDLQMLHAARRINNGEELSAGPYQFGMADVAWAFAVMELLDEHGAVAEQGTSAGEIEDVGALSEIISEVEAAEDVKLVREEEEADSAESGGEGDRR
jgi:hypothetical protein